MTPHRLYAAKMKSAFCNTDLKPGKDFDLDSDISTSQLST